MYRIRKTAAYYLVLFSLMALSFGVGTLAITGEGLLSFDPELVRDIHNSERFVAHVGTEHNQTLAGDLLLGKPATAHAGGYCGHGTRWDTINGVLHKQVFLEHTNGSGGHRWKGAHFNWTGTRYTRVSDWHYETANCH